MKPQPTKSPDPFQQAIAQWRQKHALREDEPLLLCLELFRIHQDQWDALRRRELPAFSEFRDSLLQLHRHSTTLHRQAASLTEELRHHQSPSRLIVPSLGGLILSALFAFVAGILLGKFVL